MSEAARRPAGGPGWRRPLAAGLAAWAVLSWAGPAAAGTSPARAATDGSAAELTAAGLTPAAAEAAPADDPADPATGAATGPAAVTAEPNDELPVKVTIEQLDPREVRPNSTIRLTALLRNTGRAPTGPLRYRLQRGVLITTRSELTATDATFPPVATRFARFAQLPTGLAPGQVQRVRYECTAEQLRLIGVGVYPVGFVVQAVSGGGGTTTVGRAQTLLPSFAQVDPAPTRVAWLWPLLDRPHRLLGDVAGQPVFDTDELARSVAPRGRLDLLLRAAEAVTGRVSLTLVVDPELIEELRLMTKDYKVLVRGRYVAGKGQQAAAAWLKRLRRIAPRHLVAVVPYADPDVVALERGNLAELAWPGDGDVSAVDAELGVAATTRLVWPAGSLLTDVALDDVVAHDAAAVVLDASALPGGVSKATPTPSAVSPLPALDGKTVALVADAGLQSAVTHAPAFPGGLRVAEQRYLAELAMITAEQPATQRTLVVAPPRRWSPALSYAAAVLADVGRISWLTSLTASAAVASTPPVDRGPLAYPPGAEKAELPALLVQTIGEVQARVVDFHDALDNEATHELLTPYSDALRRAASSAWRGNPRLGLEYATRLGGSIDRLRQQVHIQKPFSRYYTLASADSPLTLTVVNQLSTAVTIKVRINRAPAGFRTTDIGPQNVPANSRATLRLPAEVQRTGTFPIEVQLTTPDGGSLGDPIQLIVRSTAYGSLALSITGVALLVLIGAVIFRLVRRLGSGEGEQPGPAGGPGDRSIT